METNKKKLISDSELAQIRVYLLRLLANGAVVKAKHITKNIFAEGLLQISPEDTEQVKRLKPKALFLIYRRMTTEGLLTTEGRYKWCQNNTAFRITEIGIEHLRNLEHNNSF
jgi:hypothetical protein